MNKKNMLGMEMNEWKHLSGLADPYALAFAEASAKAGVPQIVEARSPLADLPDNPHDVRNADDDVPSMPREKSGKGTRLPLIKKAARQLRQKNMSAIHAATHMPASERHRNFMDAMKKKEKGESVEDHDLWALYLEDRGTTLQEFNSLLDIAIEGNDDDLAGELLAIEGQLDELLGQIGNGLLKGAMAAGKGLAAGASAVGRTALGAAKGVAGAAGQVVGSAAKGVQTGFSPQKPAAGGGAPAGATPAAGSPPAAPAGAAPQAAAAAPATPAAPAAAPTASVGAPQKPGLLGMLARGIGKVAGGVVNGVKGMVPTVKPAMKPEDIEDLEAFLNEEFGLTAEQYVDICDLAFETNDTEMIESAHQLDEIFAAWRAKKQTATSSDSMKSLKTARDVVAKHGVDKVKAANLRGRAVEPVKSGSGTSLHAKKAESVEDVAAEIMESNAMAPRAKAGSIKELITDQLRFSGYTDEYINSKAGGR